jgi:hypothetical protein
VSHRTHPRWSQAPSTRYRCRCAHVGKTTTGTCGVKRPVMGGGPSGLRHEMAWMLGSLICAKSATPQRQQRVLHSCHPSQFQATGGEDQAECGLAKGGGLGQGPYRLGS